MDPNATLDQLIEAATSGDWETMATAYNDLRGWLKRGGFTPRDPRCPQRDVDQDPGRDFCPVCGSPDTEHTPGEGCSYPPT